MPAMAPCAGFQGACKGQCTWEPDKGHIPRGFGGATGALDEVRLVLVTAEPNGPGDGESGYSGDVETFVEQTAVFTATLIRDDSLRRKGKKAPFHRNLRRILDLCWPNLPFEEQLKRTWVTDAVLCTAKKVSRHGAIDRRVEDECVKRYLAPQIESLPRAFVIALGGKAEMRMERHGVRFDATAQHPSAKETDQNKTRRETSWQEASEKFRNWFTSSELAEIDSELEEIEASIVDGQPIPEKVMTAVKMLEARFDAI
jgi:hypothetical protein